MTVGHDLLSLRPAGGFGMVMADPPWAFLTRAPAQDTRGPDRHYECLTLDAIKAMPIPHVVARSCWLWLWATNPMLPEALAVMAAWGFTFKTAGHWAKLGPSGKLAFGTGYVLRNSGEPYLIGSRGKPRVCSRAVRSVILAPRREHSRKPDEAYRDAELLGGEVPRLDLFSRQARPGWTAWGNETHKFTPAPETPAAAA
ncbi:MT-A70 family methyltransferase [Rubellimicrobium arenae]|uniref:MT-A70 family methyltransferase n=1 Tax=Rubellimicrobium arenae TaxID=2817372 RepID=UPI001B30AFA6|nr:MT-A70 family methyltransferase [Rubellimicrobium arenae]